MSAKTNRDQKPTALEVRPDEIPAILKQGRLHVVWRWEWKEKDKKWDKPPRQPNGKPAESDNPETWVTFEEALAAYRTGKFDGIGYVLTEESGIVGMDHDDCVVYSTHRIEGAVRAIVEALGSYAEVSPSGEGLRMVALGALPAHGRKKGPVEMYVKGRYLTLTGHRLSFAPATVERREAQILQFHRSVFGESNGQNGNRPQAQPAPIAEDDELLSRMRSWKNGGDFSILFDHGDWRRYASQSDADLALANYLAFATNSAQDQIDRLFRRSLMMREKWDEKHYSDGRTYGQGTIDTALKAVREGWKPGQPLLGPVKSLPQPVLDDEGEFTPLGKIAGTTTYRAVKWLWPGRLPLGMLVMLDGDPELGKSTLSYDWAARVTTGRDWPDGPPSIPGGVVIIAGEDSLENVIGPRLQAAGANLDRVSVISSIPTPEGPRLPSLPEDIRLLKREIEGMKARLLVFDPIMPYIASALNANKDGDVRKALTPLAEMLEATGCTGLLLRHLNKDDKTSNALYRGLHSIAFIALARAAMAVSKDPDQQGRMVLAMTKSNLGFKPPSLRYGIEGVELGLDQEGLMIKTSRVQWLGESTHTATTLITAFGKDAPRQTAAELLVKMVIEPDKEIDANKIWRAADAAGIASATLKRAKMELGITARKVGFGDDGHWVWGPGIAEGDHKGGPLGATESSLENRLRVVSQSDPLSDPLSKDVIPLVSRFVDQNAKGINLGDTARARPGVDEICANCHHDLPDWGRDLDRDGYFCLYCDSPWAAAVA